MNVPLFLYTVALFAAGSAMAEPNPLRPAKISWGGYKHNEQFAEPKANWPFTQKHMDGLFFHGAYWLKPEDDEIRRNLEALAPILRRNNKPVFVETGFGQAEKFDPADVKTHKPWVRAQTDIAHFKAWNEKYGINVTDVRVDWFPMWAMAAYAEKFQTTDMRQLMAMVTGAESVFGSVPGFDMKQASWVEYGLEMKKALPNVALTFDQALCNHRPLVDPDMRKLVPWPGFGYGYERKISFESGKPALVNGKQLTVKFDFADQLNGVIVSSSANGIHFTGFEGDTPYNYITGNIPEFPREKLVDYLITVERSLHKQGLANGRIINDCGTAYGDGDTSWVQIDLGAPVELDRVRIVWGAGYAREWLLKAGIDATHLAALGTRTKSGTGGDTDLKFKPRKARILRLELHERGTDRGFQIAEVEAYGPADPKTNLALRKAVAAHSANTKQGALAVVDGDPKTHWESNNIPNAQWDRQYHDRTLEYLEFYQSSGGRADHYIAESWYDGPFAFFPETKVGTFSNLARDVIRRIKGIDDDGTLMKVSLTAKPLVGEPGTYALRIRNDAPDRNPRDARATPLLRATADRENEIRCHTENGKDVTDEVFCRKNSDGWFVGGLNAGESRTVFVRVAGSGVKFHLYWNPQDPSSAPRDSLSIAAHLK